MLSDADIKKLKAVFATKDDLKNFATKDDLKNFATKDDIQQLKTEVGALKSRIDILEDNIVGEIAKLHDENLVTSSYRGIIDNHETRLTKVEQTIAVVN